MSKSWGNVINPLDIIETNSTDSLRLSLAIGNTPGNNLNFSIKLVDNNQVFLNKFWNIARFIATNI
jgi:valyl-tRNA synthetase